MIMLISIATSVTKVTGDWIERTRFQLSSQNVDHDELLNFMYGSDINIDVTVRLGFSLGLGATE